MTVASASKNLKLDRMRLMERRFAKCSLKYNFDFIVILGAGSPSAKEI